MLANFFNDHDFIQSYRVTFSYRYSPEYEAGLKKRVAVLPDGAPLKLLDLSRTIAQIPFRSLRILLYLFYHFFLIKYFCVLWNTGVIYRSFGGDKIDILHINNGGYPGASSCMSVVFAARLRGITEIVYVVNNIAFSYRFYWRWLDYFFDRIVAQTVTKFVCGSKTASRALATTLRLDNKKIITQPNGIASRKITETKEDVLQRLGLPEKRLLMAIVAILEDRKGHIYLLRAMHILKTSGLLKSMPLLLIEGSGPNAQHLKNFVSDSGLTEDVLFVGHEEHVFNLLNAVDIVMLPSVANEDFPNIVIEAMSLRKVVIASRISGTPEQIEEGSSGLLVDCKDVEGLVNAIRRVCENESLRHLLSSNARQRFKRFFSATVAVNNYRKIYEKLINDQNKSV